MFYSYGLVVLILEHNNNNIVRLLDTIPQFFFAPFFAPFFALRRQLP
jgi:hypothetical protein